MWGLLLTPVVIVAVAFFVLVSPGVRDRIRARMGPRVPDKI